MKSCGGQIDIPINFGILSSLGANPIEITITRDDIEKFFGQTLPVVSKPQNNKEQNIMKKLRCSLMFSVLALACILLTGCTSTGKSFFGIVKGVAMPDDYEAAGRMVGEAAYMGYVIMKGDPKYDKYTSKAEEIYAALDNAESFDTASVNQVALEILQAALTDRYGYVKAFLITDAVRVGGVIADRLLMKDVSAEEATLYAKGLKEGIDEARSKTPAIALDEAAAKAKEKADKEKAKKEAESKGETYVEEDEWAEPKYITCKPVKTCVYKFTDRTLSVQKRIAQELDKFGFLDKTEQPEDEFDIPKYKNVLDLITRCNDLEKFGVTRLNVWISDVKVDCKWALDEDGKEKLDKDGNKIADCKLVSIRFLSQQSDGSTKETKCVGCATYTELEDVIKLSSN